MEPARKPALPWFAFVGSGAGALGQGFASFFAGLLFFFGFSRFGSLGASSTSKNCIAGADGGASGSGGGGMAGCSTADRNAGVERFGGGSSRPSSCAMSVSATSGETAPSIAICTMRATSGADDDDSGFGFVRASVRSSTMFSSVVARSSTKPSRLRRVSTFAETGSSPSWSVDASGGGGDEPRSLSLSKSGNDFGGGRGVLSTLGCFREYETSGFDIIFINSLSFLCTAAPNAPMGPLEFSNADMTLFFASAFCTWCVRTLRSSFDQVHAIHGRHERPRPAPVKVAVIDAHEHLLKQPYVVLAVRAFAPFVGAKAREHHRDELLQFFIRRFHGPTVHERVLGVRCYRALSSPSVRGDRRARLVPRVRQDLRPQAGQGREATPGICL